MTNQAYGQFCGLARALEVVGEPWAMLVIRDLLAGAKSFADLQHGLPVVSAGLLGTRLRELEQASVVIRTTPAGDPEPAVYELTAFGRELEPVVIGLARWGVRALGGLRQDEIVTPDSMIMALRVTFRAEAAKGLRLNFTLEISDFVVHARIENGMLIAGRGTLPNPDLIIHAGPVLKSLMAGEMSPREAMESGGIRLRGPEGSVGDPALLAWFAELFHILPAPPPAITIDGLVPMAVPPPPEVLAISATAG